MSVDDIEVRFELYVDGVIWGKDRARYHNVGEIILKKDDREVRRKARYDTNEDVIEIRSTYYLGQETVEKYDWTQRGSVHSDEEDVTISDADVSLSESDLDEAISTYLKSVFFADPEAELGEIFDDQLD